MYTDCTSRVLYLVGSCLRMWQLSDFFSLYSSWWGKIYFNTNCPTSTIWTLTFFLKVWVILCWYNLSWKTTPILFSLINANYSYRSWTNWTSFNPSSRIILKDGMSTLVGINVVFRIPKIKKFPQLRSGLWCDNLTNHKANFHARICSFQSFV